MDSELFCGLTEKEANEALINWHCEQFGTDWEYWLDPNDMQRLSYIDIEPDVFVKLFTVDLNACSLIQKCLTPEQQMKYAHLIDSQCPESRALHTSTYWLIALDAPARVRALLQVLGLGKEQP